MKKDEKIAYANWKIMKGAAVFLFGGIWMYLTSVFFDVWSALPPTLAIMGLLCLLFGFFKKSQV